MNQNRTENILLLLSFLLGILVIIVSCVGLLTPDFYSRETPGWQAQCIGQDLIDLFLVAPALLLSAILLYRKNKNAITVLGGVLLYLIYTFVIYSFDIHFNRLFIIYCFILGLSFYSFIYFLSVKVKGSDQIEFTSLLPVNITGIYFIIIAIVFYFLWLSAIIPGIITNTVPVSLAETGLCTNPVHILDLALLLPGLFITGVWMLKKKPMGLLLAPVFLTFFILMDLTIGALILVMNERGIEADLKITIIMALLAFLSMIMLTWYLKNIKQSK